MERGPAGDGIADTQLSEEQQAEIDQFLNAFQAVSLREMKNLRPNWLRSKRRALRSHLTQRLTRDQRKLDRQGNELLVVESVEGTLTLETKLHLEEGRRPIVQYAQAVRDGESGLALAENLHLLSFRGLSPRTAWEASTERSVEELAEAVVAAVDYGRVLVATIARSWSETRNAP